MINAVIRGTGGYLPKRSVSNAELEKKVQTTDEWITARTGIKSRFIADETETTSFMAVEAARHAIAAAEIAPGDIDLILVATCTPDRYFPSVACYVQGALGIAESIPAMDVGAACSGFMYALDVAHQYISTGSKKNILVIGSECMSSALDWTDRSTCILFGDGAGAVVLSASEDAGILGSVMHAKYDSDDLLQYSTYLEQATRPYIQMRGSEVFKSAVTLMGKLVDEVLEKSGIARGEVDWLVPHQANIRIIQAIARKLNVSMDNVVVTVDRHGNTSAASIPLALDHAIRQQQIKRGDLMLLESFGAGMTWGAMLVRY